MMLNYAVVGVIGGIFAYLTIRYVAEFKTYPFKRITSCQCGNSKNPALVHFTELCQPYDELIE